MRVKDPKPRIDLAGGYLAGAAVRPPDAESDAPTVRVLVSGEWRVVDAAVWGALQGPTPPAGFENNGCTASPDVLTDGAETWPACVIHDWHYSGRVPGMTRWRADGTLRTNLWRCLRAQGCNWFRAGYIAGAYWFAVRRVGGAAWTEPRAVPA